MIALASNILLHFNFIVIPVYCIYRLRKNSHFIFLNPCFYFLFFSYFYLTVSSLLLDESTFFILHGALTFSAVSVHATNLLCNWFTLVAFWFYVLSKDNKLVPLNSFIPKALTRKIALFLTLLISLVYLRIFVIFGPTLLSLFGQRSELATIFDNQIYYQYRIGSVINILLASTTVLVWSKKNFKWYFFLLLPISLDLLCNGRSMALVSIIFAYINYVVISKKTRVLLILSAITALIAVGLLRLTLTGNFFVNAALFFAEVLIGRITVLLVYNDFLGYGDLLDYLINSSLVKIMPGAIAKLFFSDYSNFGYIQTLGETYKIAMSGNLVSESLFYGGVFFAIATPIIMGAIFYFLNRIQICKTFPGFIYYCFIISYFLGIMRNGFYQFFLVNIYLMYTYLSWILFLEWGRAVMIKSKINQQYFHKIYIKQP